MLHMPAREARDPHRFRPRPSHDAPALTLTLVLALCLALESPPAAAQETPEEIAASCIACHGEDGVPVSGDIPVIHGQHFAYLYGELQDFASRRREHDVMSNIAQGLSPEEMKSVSEWLAAQPWPRVEAAAVPDQIEAVAEKGINAGMCAQCHLSGFVGTNAVPRLSGQQAAYLAKTLKDMKSRARTNSAAMSALVGHYSDEDIDAIARVLAAR